MAKSAAKQLSTRNTARLNQTHLITAALHTIFLLSRFTFRRSLSLTRYTLFCLPATLIEAYLHILATPSYDPEGKIRSAGSDLNEKGLTEFMWDVLYWTWINMVLVVLVGNWGWWAYLVVPGYAAYAIVPTVGGIKGMLSGMGGGGVEGGAAGQSKRQQKMEKRGGQRVAYR
ncbi:uncharacterized protein AB675_11436 [Cyphellophora attinorum]|uniref:DUF788 domain-containing protein n=1 Tax=Cyphellophora attinorum TaxID=1664694 RepID=A0A0N1HTP5_9EURO|nr:uncharacterized protein AB675_11436 [Phialophora attinorum]KPI39974.1 hypothetical protein AB675_11436 [Phialophora attinorum]